MSLFSDLFGSNQDTTKNTSQNFSTGPSAFQQPFLNTAFQGAAGALQTAQADDATQAPTAFTAGMTPQQLALFNSMLGYSSSNTSPNLQTGTGSSLLTGGATGAQGALNALGGFNAGDTNNTSAVLAAANAYANNPAISGEVQAATQDAVNTANEITLPGYARAGNVTGNTDSSTIGMGTPNGGGGGIAAGLVQKGLAEDAANASATLRGNAFDTGVQTAENQLTNNNTANLSALTSAGALGSNLAATGSGAISDAINNESSLFNIGSEGGAGQQQNNQDFLTNALQKYQFGNQSPFDALNQYYGIVGNQQWGTQGVSNGTATQDTTTTQSPFSVVSSLLGGANTLAGGTGTGLLSTGAKALSSFLL